MGLFPATGRRLRPNMRLVAIRNALYWLHRALPPETSAQNAYMLVIALKTSPEYDTLWSDARFQELVRQLGLPQ